MRWLLRLGFTIVVLVLLAVGAVLLLPGEKIAGFVQDRFEAATGRALTLSGGLSATLYPSLGVRTGAVEIANADWSKSGPMLKAEGMSIGVDLIPLLKGEVRIRSIRVLSPSILLERARDGRANWEFGAAAAPSPGGSPARTPARASGSSLPPFSVALSTMRNGTVRYVDHALGTTYELRDLDAEMRLPDFAGRADFELSGRLRDQPLTLKGHVAGFGGFLAGAVSPVVAETGVGGSNIRFDGRAGLSPLAADGQINANLGDMPALFAALGQSAPTLPRGLGRSARVQGHAIYTGKGSVHLRDGTIDMDQNSLRADMDLFLEDIPRLEGKLSTAMLDLSGLDGGAKAGDDAGARAGVGAGWSKQKMDVSGLSALNGEVSLQSDAIRVAGANLGQSRVLLRLDRGRAVFELSQMRAYGGAITGQLVVNGRNGLSVGGRLKTSDLEMQPLLRDVAGYERLIGSGNLDLKFLGLGNSTYAIAHSLSGDGSLSLGKGELKGLDLVGMLRNLDASYQGKGAKTIFDSINATFTIRDGVLANDDLAFKAPLATATGKGTVNIGERTLDYRVTPVALSDAAGNGGISVPVLITGSWAHPKFRPDLKGLLQGDLGAKGDALKKRVEDAVGEAVTNSLGVAPQEGETPKAAIRRELGVAPGEQISPEDAIKRKLEDEAGKGLLNLLGGN